jgi:succinate-acetate transporter protein
MAELAADPIGPAASRVRRSGWSVEAGLRNIREEDRMSTAPTVAHGTDGDRHYYRPDGDRDERHLYWLDHSRIVLTPTAAPSVLGLFGFFAATLAVGSNLAGWWGNDTTTALYLAPMAVFFGGVAQFAAGLFAFRARDTLATAMHGIWGAFWMAWGLYELLVASGTITGVVGSYFPAMGFWFLALAMITLSGALATLARNVSIFAVLAPLATGSGFAAAGYIGGYLTPLRVGGWLFVFAAGFAWYAATAMLLESSYGRVILPVGKWNLRSNVPGGEPNNPIEYLEGMPGARVGQ